MTTREFHLIDSVNLWDSIFYEYYLEPNDNKFNLLDCVCLSMITYVRTECKFEQDFIINKFFKCWQKEMIQLVYNDC